MFLVLQSPERDQTPCSCPSGSHREVGSHLEEDDDEATGSKEQGQHHERLVYLRTEQQVYGDLHRLTQKGGVNMQKFLRRCGCPRCRNKARENGSAGGTWFQTRMNTRLETLVR